VHEVAVKDHDHVVEEERFEGLESGRDLRARWCAVDNFDELLVRRDLFVHCGLGVVELFLRVVLAAKHGEASFRWSLGGHHRIRR
jgi:hypothetical protein